MPGDQSSLVIAPYVPSALDLPLARDHHGHLLLPWFTNDFLDELRSLGYVK